MKEVWLVTGVRGAGKSAVSRQLASHFERGIYISGDQLCDLIVTGQVDPDGKPADEAESQIELTQRNMCLLAQSFSDAGFVPVLDWVVRHQRDLSMFLQGLSGCTPYIVVLAPGLPTVAQRKPEAFRRWAHLEPELIQELSRIGLWVDTSDLGVEETVSHILATKAHAKMVPTDRKREENGYVSRVITRDEFNKRLVELCLKSGLTGFPRKFRDRHILLRSVALTLGAAREYTESELDDRLTFWLTDIAQSIDFDHVSLRRTLVDEGYLKREKDGTSYRIDVTGPSKGLFEPNVEEVDVYEAIGIGMKSIQQRKQEHLQRR